MPDHKDTFENGRAALRDIKHSLLAGAGDVRDGFRKAGQTAMGQAEAVGDTVRHARADVATRIRDGVEIVHEEIEEGIEAAGEYFDDAAGTGRAAWAQATDAVREVSEDMLASARDTFADVQEEVRHYVRAKPLGALAIAAAAGFAVAFIMRRSR